jgi:hypothetical protein
MPVLNISAYVVAHGIPIELSIAAGRGFDQHLLRIR